MYDMNMRLKSSKEKDVRITVKRLFELGWDCVAWTTVANGKVSSNLIKPSKCILLEPIQRREALVLRSLVTGHSAIQDIRQLSRITVTVDDVIDAQSLTVGNAILNSFDIVAARPGNMKVMAYLCKTADIDIITLDFTHRLPFAANKKLLDEAVKRGIFIEILYSPIIGASSGARQEVFSNTRILIQYLRGKNIIISSGADNLAQIRGPMDVCNIGVALGLTNEQAINAVANNCATVLKHAVARKCRYLPLEVISKLDFKLRFPEISMDDSQSNNHNVPCVLSEDNPLKADLLDDDIDEDCDDEIEESQMNDDSFALYCTPRMVLGNSNDGTEIKPEKSEGSFNRADENDEKYSENGDNCDNDKVDDENDNENPSGYGLSFTGDDVGLTPNFIDSSEIFVKEIVGEENNFISSIDVKSQQRSNVEGMNTESREHKDGHGSILDISLNDDFDLGDSFISFSTSSSSRKRRIEEDIVEEEKILQPVLQSPIVVIKSSQHSIKKIKINKLNTMKIKTKKFMTKKIKR